MSHIIYNSSFLANIFESVISVLSFGAIDRISKEGLGWLPCGDLLVLDAATGTGRVAKLLAKLRPTLSLIGMDRSNEMLASARRTTQSSKVKYINADITKIPSGDLSYDIVISSFLLHELNKDDRLKFYNEVKRILKVNGVFLIIDYALPKNLLIRSIFKNITALVEPKCFKQYLYVKEDELLRESGTVLKSATALYCFETKLVTFS